MQSQGLHNIVWDGCDITGCAVGAGLYFYQLKCGQYTDSGKMLLMDGGKAPYNGKIPGDSSLRTFTGKAGNSSEDETYRITITQKDILSYEEDGVSITDGDTLDFVVTRIPVTSFVSIPGGTFEMGDEIGDLWDNCRPAHYVTVPDFEMSAYEITNEQYVMFLNEVLVSGTITPSEWDVKGETQQWGLQTYIDLSDTRFEIVYYEDEFWAIEGQERFPVQGVTWYGAKQFALFYGLDLPTEAEWEYACRGGNRYLYGTSDGTIGFYKANYIANGSEKTEVGSFPANPFGLYDICGNLQEWCHDWYGEYTARSVNNPLINPIGPSHGTFRILRGGSWTEDAIACRSAARQDNYPDVSYNYIGFRVVRRPGGVTY